MSRITYRDEYGDVRPEFGYTLADAVEKLAHYEDLEEQGYKMVNIDKVVEQLEKELYYEMEPMQIAFDQGIRTAIEIVKGETNE